MKASPSIRRASGFTLLEVVLAVALMAIVVGMVFGVARTSLALGNGIVSSQNEEMKQQAFFDFLGQYFSALPGNTRFNLKVEDSSTHYLSELTLQNVPLSFTWGGEERVAKAVQLCTVKRVRSGYVDVVLRYYENEILEENTTTAGGVSKTTDEKPFAEIVLMEDLAYFEWRVLDGRTMEWQYDWEVQGRQPLQLELTLSIGANGQELRHIFWMPPKQSPEVLMRQMNQGGGPSNSGGGQPGGQPGGGPSITIPGGPVPNPGGGKR